MNLDWPSKDLDEVLDFTWTVPLDDGDTISGTPTAALLAGTVSLGAATQNGALVTTVISGGQPSENAIVKMTAQTAGGRTFVEEFLLRVNAAAAVPTDADTIRAEIIELKAAQMRLGKGETIVEVWRNGRRLIKGKVTIESLQKLIDIKQRDLEGAIATEAGGRRRRGIALAWQN